MLQVTYYRFKMPQVLREKNVSEIFCIQLYIVCVIMCVCVCVCVCARVREFKNIYIQFIII